MREIKEVPNSSVQPTWKSARLMLRLGLSLKTSLDQPEREAATEPGEATVAACGGEATPQGAGSGPRQAYAVPAA